jgi:multiple sugar transport system substrate-binding protein
MKIKKFTALAICLVMILAFAAACATDGGGSGAYVCNCDVIELTFSNWGDESERESTQRAIDVFNNMQDRINVTVIQIPNEEYGARLRTMQTGGTMPDCGMIDERTAIGWTREGLIKKIDIYEGQPHRPFAGITFSDGGNPIAYSIGSEVLCLWFNRDMFDAAGIPHPPATLDTAWTWDEMIEVAKLLTLDSSGRNLNDPNFNANNIVQYGVQINPWAWQLEVWALSNGGRWYSSDGTRAIFDDAAIEAMQMVYDLHLVHKVAPFNAGQLDNGWHSSVGAGNVAMGTDGQWAVGFTMDSDINYGVGVLPYMKQQANITAGGPVGVFADTKHPEAAAEFLRWYSDPENNWAPILDGWIMPNTTNWFTEEALLTRWIEEVPNRARLDAGRFRTAVADVALHPSTVPTGWYYTPNTDQIDRILIPVLTEAASGAKTAKEVIESVRSQLEAAVAG